jgi:D-sedoheptulose 7-phosphate isomerase
MSTWQQDIDKIHMLLAGLSFRDRAGRTLDVEAAFQSWRRLTIALRHSHRTVYLIGNGASASMASHYAADLAKNARLHTEVFSDLSLITAISNDLGYEKVFSEPLRRRAKRADMLVAISSSGKSRNILAAVDVARRLGMSVVTLSAMSPRNPLRSLGDLNAFVATEVYGLAETCHAAILHRWMDLMEVNT